MLVITHDKCQHTSIVRLQPEQAFIILHILLRVLVKHRCIDKSIFNDRRDRFHLLTDKQILATLLSARINPFNRTPHDLTDRQLVKWFCHIFEHTQIYSFLCIIKFIIGREHDKFRRLIALFDLTYCIDSIDPRHLYIHEHDIRSEDLSQFDHITPGACHLDLTFIRKIFLNDHLQGITHDSLIIS